jgi:hypothetical protein
MKLNCFELEGVFHATLFIGPYQATASSPSMKDAIINANKKLITIFYNLKLKKCQSERWGLHTAN